MSPSVLGLFNERLIKEDLTLIINELLTPFFVRFSLVKAAEAMQT
jgi:hypothetical protein